MNKKKLDKYYKCSCGAVGNWKEFIKKGLCHRKIDSNLITINKSKNKFYKGKNL